MQAGERQPEFLKPKSTTRLCQRGEVNLGWVYITGYTAGTADRVQQLPIPVLEYEVEKNSIVVVNSRLFLIGGQLAPNNDMDDDPSEVGVSFLDLNQLEEEAWRVAARFAAGQQDHALACSDGWIYCVGHISGRFHSQTFQWEPSRNLAKEFNISLLGASRTVQYANVQYVNLQGIEGRVNAMCHCHEGMQHLEICGTLAHEYKGYWYPRVVVGRHLICVSNAHPITGAYSCRMLYVYDTGRMRWMQRPVQGLVMNSYMLPFQREQDVGMTALIKVGPHRYALVWSRECTVEDSQFEIHWCKFDLRLHHGVIEGKTVLDDYFSAVRVAHGMCMFEDVGFDTTLLNITSDV